MENTFSHILYIISVQLAIDDGFLLRRQMHLNELFSSILQKYVDYAKKQFSPWATIAFYGYIEAIAAKITKSTERI